MTDRVQSRWMDEKIMSPPHLKRGITMIMIYLRD